MSITRCCLAVSLLTTCLAPTPTPAQETVVAPGVVSSGDPCPEPYHRRLRQKWDAYIEYCRAKYWGYPQYFCERPFGVLNVEHYRQQVANGDVNRQILFHYDFFDETDTRAAQLTLRGHDELVRIASMVMRTGAPLLIQRTPGNAELDEQRRESVIEALARLELDLPPEMVVVGKPTAIGRADGLENLIIYENQLMQTESAVIINRGGSGRGGGSGGASIFGGGGGGGVGGGGGGNQGGR